MVAPVIIAAGVAAAAQLASAGMQWLNSRDAQRASDRERERVRALIDAVQDPQFDMRNINPESLTVLQKYVPETAPYIKEVAPQVVEARSQGAMAGRQAQLEALGKYRQLMDQGYDVQTAMEMARAQRGAAAEAASARQTAGLEAQRRGFGGGLSMLQAGAGAQAQDRMAQLQAQALADAAARRTQATGLYGAMGGQIRGEDINLERGNIDIINAYNQRMAQAQQNWANAGADIRNQAQLYNVKEAQRIDEANKQARYNAGLQQQGQRNTLAQQQYQNAMGRATGQVPMAQWASQDAYNRAAQQNQALQAGSDLASKAAGAYAGYKQQQADDQRYQDYMDRVYPKKG